MDTLSDSDRVSTHSRAESAANFFYFKGAEDGVSTHSRAEAAAIPPQWQVAPKKVTTHSHPKVAADEIANSSIATFSFNTQPPEGGCASALRQALTIRRFQHTATRRWLLLISPIYN